MTDRSIVKLRSDGSIDLEVGPVRPDGLYLGFDETSARPAASTDLLLELPPHSAKVWHLSPDRTPPPWGMTLGGFVPS